MQMLIRIHRETRPGERRVALVPKTVRRLVDAGHRVLFPSGVGAASDYSDEDYTDAGAELYEGSPPEADLVAAVGPVTWKRVPPSSAHSTPAMIAV